MLSVYVRSLKLNGTSVFSASVWACPVESFSCLGQEGMGHYPWWVWRRISIEHRPLARPREEHLYCELCLCDVYT